MRRAGRPALAAALLLAALVAGGCAWFVHTQGFRYDRVERAPKVKDHPIPILAQEPHGRPFVVIGMVQAEARQATGGLGEREMKEGLCREARRMGGDALIRVQRLPSIRSAPEHLLDGQRRDTDGLQGRMASRWVAEVITFDVPAAAPVDPPAAGPAHHP